MMDERRYFVKLLKKVQVNVPFLRLKNDYLPLFMEYGMNPEIGIDAAALDSVSDKEFRNIAEILKINHRKITLHGPFMDLVPGGLDNRLLKATRKRLERFFEILPVFEPVNVACKVNSAWRPHPRANHTRTTPVFQLSSAAARRARLAAGQYLLRW